LFVYEAPRKTNRFESLADATLFQNKSFAMCIKSAYFTGRFLAVCSVGSRIVVDDISRREACSGFLENKCMFIFRKIPF
jgi:hypothetical protein